MTHEKQLRIEICLTSSPFLVGFLSTRRAAELVRMARRRSLTELPGWLTNDFMVVIFPCPFFFRRWGFKSDIRADHQQY